MLKCMTMADMQGFGRCVIARHHLLYDRAKDPRHHHKSRHRMLQQVSVATAIILMIIKGYCSSQLLQRVMLGLEKLRGPPMLNQHHQAKDRVTLKARQKHQVG